jgi:hypothetical protein
MTLSELIRREGLERVDVLKIDAENSEWNILAGIASSDWPRIRQVAIEVHDWDNRVARIVELLRSEDFETAVDTDPTLARMRLAHVLASRATAS